MIIKNDAIYKINRKPIPLFADTICFIPLRTKYLLFNMIIVPVKENDSIDKALKKFKKKFEKTGIVRQLRARQAYEKKSVARRTTIKKAIYRNKMKDQIITK